MVIFDAIVWHRLPLRMKNKCMAAVRGAMHLFCVGGWLGLVGGDGEGCRAEVGGGCCEGDGARGGGALDDGGAFAAE